MVMGAKMVSKSDLLEYTKKEKFNTMIDFVGLTGETRKEQNPL